MSGVETIETSKLISSLIGDILKPKISSIIELAQKSVTKKFNILSHDFYENRFNDYLSRRYLKYFTIETLVIPNYQMSFDNIYLPLTIKSNNEEILINHYPEELFSKYFRIIIQDTAGMGKSMIIRKIFLETIRNNSKIPVLIELRKLNKENTILKEFLNQINSINEKCEELFVLELINRGDFVFLFDGLDEISLNNRDFVLNDLNSFIEKAYNNYFVITSRPEESLKSFGGFISFNIKELTIDQTFKLFELYDNYNKRPIASDLSNLIKNGKYDGVKEFLGTPFLSTLLYKTFDYRKNIPSYKPQYYRMVYDALFENHDLTKEGYYKRDKYCGLHIDDFEQVLRYVGYKSMREGKIEFSKDEILHIINCAKTHCIGLEFQPSDFLEDLIKTVPLFRIEGLQYRWAHKNLQDYFAARFICIDTKDKRNKILLELSQTNKYDDLIDIYASIDYKSFKHVILKSFVDEFINYYDRSILFFCDIDLNLAQQRIEYIFTNHYYLKAYFLRDNNKMSPNEIYKIHEDIKEIIKEDIENNYHDINIFDKQVGNFMVFVFWQKRKYYPKYLTNRFKDILQKNPDIEKLKKNRETNNFLTKIASYNFVKVEKKTLNEVNSLKYFEIVNTLLQFSGGFVPCYNKYTKLKNEIDSEIFREQESEDF